MMYTGKQLRALVMPLMFEQFLNVMVGMVDTLMVSKAGEAAVSGVALTTNINPVSYTHLTYFIER